MAEAEYTPSNALAAAIGLRGTKPVIDLSRPIQPVDVNRTTVASALAVLPDIQAIAKRWGAFETNQLLKAWNKLMPGFSGLTGMATDLAKSYMKGEIPADVLKSIQDAVAAASAGRGTSGSTFQFADATRSLGLTSLDLSKTGTAMYGNLANMFMPYAPMRGLASGMVERVAPLNAGQTGQLMQWNEQRRWETQMMKNIKDAMPSPAQTALANAWGQIDADIQDFFKTAYGGGGAAKMGSSIGSPKPPSKGGSSGGSYAF